MSKHPAWVKVIVLDFIRERLYRAADVLGIDREKIRVYDPFTTEMDFYLWMDISWEKYRHLYSKYYSTDLDNGDIEEVVLGRWKNLWNPYGETQAAIWTKALEVIADSATQESVFNASTSKTTIHYGVGDMVNLLLLEEKTMIRRTNPDNRNRY